MNLFYASIDDVPKDLLTYYVERDGERGKGYYLDVVGADTVGGSNAPDPNVARLEAELATSQASLTAKDGELRAAKGTLGRIDMDKYDQVIAREREAAASNKQTLSQAEIDAIVDQRTASMGVDHASQLEEKDKLISSLQGDVSTTRSQLGTYSIDQSLIAAIGQLSMKLRPGAQQDFLVRGRAAWSIDDAAKPIPKGPDDAQIRYGKDANPETMQEWVRKIATTSGKHLFENGSGGGGNPSDNLGANADGVRYCTQEDINSGKVDIKDVFAGKRVVKS